MKEMELLLYNGTILTMDEKNSIKEWVVVKNGRIFDLGDKDGFKKYIEVSNEVIDLSGKTLLPGFYDSHVHLVQTGLNILSFDASKVISIPELLELIYEKSKKIPNGELIRIIGYDESKVMEKRLPTRYELDSSTQNNPVWVNTVEYHTSVVNSLALHKLNLPFNLEGVIRDDRGLPDGRFVSKASSMVRNNIFNIIPDSVRKKGVSKALNLAIENGVTSINAMEGGFTFHDKDTRFIRENKNFFPIDLILFYQTTDVEKVISNGLKRVGGCIFLDGSFNSRTAALSRPYNDDKETRGTLYFTQEELNHFVLQAHKNNMQIAMHAIGDRAIDQILNAYEIALSLYPKKDHRHRIEHFELVTEAQIYRAKKLNLVLSMQPAYEYFWGGARGMYDTRLGPERRKITNPLRKITDEGLMIAGGSDSDVTPINPILGMHAAANHPTKDSSLDILEAIKIFTINGAKAVFEENIKGSVEKGKYGDFVILDKNPLKVNTINIKNIEVRGTIKEGNILFIK